MKLLSLRRGKVDHIYRGHAQVKIGEEDFLIFPMAECPCELDDDVVEICYYGKGSTGSHSRICEIFVVTDECDIMVKLKGLYNE